MDRPKEGPSEAGRMSLGPEPKPMKWIDLRRGPAKLGGDLMPRIEANECVREDALRSRTGGNKLAF